MSWAPPEVFETGVRSAEFRRDTRFPDRAAVSRGNHSRCLAGGHLHDFRGVPGRARAIPVPGSSPAGSRVSRSWPGYAALAARRESDEIRRRRLRTRPQLHRRPNQQTPTQNPRRHPELGRRRGGGTSAPGPHGINEDFGPNCSRQWLQTPLLGSSPTKSPIVLTAVIALQSLL